MDVNFHKISQMMIELKPKRRELKIQSAGEERKTSLPSRKFMPRRWHYYYYNNIWSLFHVDSTSETNVASRQ